MCKVFAMTNTTQFKVGSKFVSIVRNEVCRHADQDGFGYAILSKNGDIGGERTIRPLNFRPLIDPASPDTTKKLPIVLDANNMFGKIDTTNAKSFIGHGRLSTNTISLPNTHPFTNGEVALIHNGMVKDPTNNLKNLTSTCDSEILLRYWEKGGMDAIEKMVTGYYAVAILDKSGKLHIIRDDRADLFISYNRTVDSFMIATTAEIIRNVAKEMKWKIEHPEEILEKTYTVFDSNAILKHVSISPRTSEYGGYYGEAYRDHSSNSSRSTYGGGGSVVTYEGGVRKVEGSSSTPPASSSANTSSLGGASDDRFASEGMYDMAGDGENYSEGNPEGEPVPRYRELSGRVDGNTSTTEETTSSVPISQSLAERSTSHGSSVHTIGEGDLTQEERIELIVAEIEDWKMKKTGSGAV
jgi:predicted glutamine amidotransferase